ncbi:MAG: single-stranded DNA-binding protein [Candidatus Levybacteria bacterium]|nr:single-stranded DNA-binding protein [Candidatus Levybacteria bacterium]
MARSLNRVQLIGNLTRDPELRYTPSGTAVCSFGLATNRYWTTDQGEKHEESEFHNIVAWNKLAELCSQFLVKGRKVYVEGRLATRSWTGQDGQQRTRTEIVIEDMILLDRNPNLAARKEETHSTDSGFTQKVHPEGQAKETKAEQPAASVPDSDEAVSPEDIPF